jgi:hypothetical protein
VFDQHRQQMQSNMEQKYEQHLDQLVKDGKITDAQKQLILAKHKEIVQKMQSNKDSFKNMTADQRKQAMQQEKTDLENWAKQNNIDLKYVVGGFGMRMHKFKGMNK